MKSADGKQIVVRTRCAKRLQRGSMPSCSNPFPRFQRSQFGFDSIATELDRYPFLVVLAPSRAGKTEYARSLFQNPLLLQVGDLQHFPDGLRLFDRKTHDAIILDDLRDFNFCVLHQERLQGKVSTKLEFASTASGMFAYSKWLWKVPLVFTANYTTRSRELLQNNDFLGRAENRVLVELPARDWSMHSRSSGS